MSISFLPTIQTYLMTFKDKVTNSLSAEQKRVAVIAFAIFSAFALIYVASCYVLKKYQAQENRIQDLENRYTTDANTKKIDELLKKTKADIWLACRDIDLDSFKSIEFNINIVDHDKVIKKTYTITKNKATFDQDDLSDEIDSVLAGVKEFIEVAHAPDISIEWTHNTFFN